MNKLYYVSANGEVGRVEYYICSKNKKQIKEIVLKRLKNDFWYLISEEDIRNHKYTSFEDLYNDMFNIEYIGLASKKIKINDALKSYMTLYKYEPYFDEEDYL